MMAEAVKEDLNVTAPRQEWVCAARGFETESGKAGIMFYPLVDGRLGEQRVHVAKKFRQAHIGMVYSIHATDDACYPATLEYVRRYEDKEKVMQWEVEQVVRDSEKKRKQALRDAKHASLIAEQLEPLRKIYLRSMNRAGFELAVLRYLRLGRFE
jgi:hypothetical protein